jgi:predicted nucleic acid-binding protein
MRIYADTSVFGGVFDEEFATPSRAFFDRVRRKRLELVLSPVVAGEIVDAPYYRHPLAAGGRRR